MKGVDVMFVSNIGLEICLKLIFLLAEIIDLTWINMIYMIIILMQKYNNVKLTNLSIEIIAGE